ncbi:DUF4142 domain-containing protein [Anthocerotibacter panamensis]|uniref:DUF4142 domain-containing protein n=1 Tax=Anthocerotibacter panamensis TaxID=2857077 RepID=UPI001C408182|nr:DUF4142 domain-containing protein [Anthocerotibacter panamensis]
MPKLSSIVAGFLVAGLFLTLGHAALAKDRSPRTTVVRTAPQDSAFLRQVAQSDSVAIKFSQLALEKATTPAVKQYAQKIVEDHTQSNQKLKQLALEREIPLPSDTLQPNKQAQYNTLSKIPGIEFDGAYLRQQVQEHTSTVALYEKQLQEGKAPLVKRFAARTLPMILTHQQEARALANQLGALKPARKPRKEAPHKPTSGS